MAAKDKDGVTIKKDDNVFYDGKIWVVDRVTLDKRLYLSSFGNEVTVKAVDVTKYR